MEINWIKLRKICKAQIRKRYEEKYSMHYSEMCRMLDSDVDIAEIYLDEKDRAEDMQREIRTHNIWK